jgi:hypothetical protein
VRANQRCLVAKAQKRELMMWEALREGLDEEMERDPTVCLMGVCTAVVVAYLDSLPAMCMLRPPR